MRPRSIGLAATVILIVALTFAWDRQSHSHWGNIAWWPLGRGVVRPLDILANIALYLPLGLTLPVRAWRRRLVAAVVVAGSLSLALELSQVWSHERIPSLLDVITNVIGALAGAAMAQWFGPDPTKATE